MYCRVSITGQSPGWPVPSLTVRAGGRCCTPAPRPRRGLGHPGHRSFRASEPISLGKVNHLQTCRRRNMGLGLGLLGRNIKWLDNVANPEKLLTSTPGQVSAPLLLPSPNSQGWAEVEVEQESRWKGGIWILGYRCTREPPPFLSPSLTFSVLVLLHLCSVFSISNWVFRFSR